MHVCGKVCVSTKEHQLPDSHCSGRSRGGQLGNVPTPTYFILNLLDRFLASWGSPKFQYLELLHNVKILSLRCK